MAPKEGDYLELAHQRATEKKSHVSFPQLKYPSLRDEGLKHPVQWLQGKAMDDNAEGLWRVHNGIYDLNEFIKKHPGGEEWLQLTKGTDITELFECHHIGTAAEEMLKKFYVREANGRRNSPFTFKDDGFYRTLKRAVREEIKKVPKDLPKRADRIIDGLFATCLINSALACWSTNYWVSMMAYLAASLSMGWIVTAAHNYIHRRPNWRMYLFNIGLWSYRDFRVSHVLSHHVYPNTLMDLEISGFEPFVSWLPRRNKSIISKFAIIIEFFVFPLGFIINFIKRFLQNFMVENFFKDHYRWHDGVAFLLPVWMSIVSGASFYDAFIMWLLIVCAASSVFFHIGSNAAHHHPKVFKDGDETEGETLDWGLHELEAVVDRNDINGNLFKVMTFFGDHALHHLFPTLDHAVLPSLYPVFYELCEKYKGNYRQTSSLNLIAAQIRMSLKKEPTLLKEKWTANNWWKT